MELTLASTLDALTRDRLFNLARVFGLDDDMPGRELELLWDLEIGARGRTRDRRARGAGGARPASEDNAGRGADRLARRELVGAPPPALQRLGVARYAFAAAPWRRSAHELWARRHPSNRA